MTSPFQKDATVMQSRPRLDRRANTPGRESAPHNHRLRIKSLMLCTEFAIDGDLDPSMFVSAAHDLKEEVGRMGVVGQVADLIYRKEAGAEIAAKAVLQGAGGLLPGEIEDQIGGRQEARRVAGEDRLVDDILR